MKEKLIILWKGILLNKKTTMTGLGMIGAALTGAQQLIQHKVIDLQQWLAILGLFGGGVGFLFAKDGDVTGTATQPAVTVKDVETTIATSLVEKGVQTFENKDGVVLAVAKNLSDIK
jgi:hypothetical protein